MLKICPQKRIRKFKRRSRKLLRISYLYRRKNHQKKLRKSLLKKPKKRLKKRSKKKFPRKFHKNSLMQLKITPSHPQQSRKSLKLSIQDLLKLRDQSQKKSKK